MNYGSGFEDTFLNLICLSEHHYMITISRTQFICQGHHWSSYVSDFWQVPTHINVHLRSSCYAIHNVQCHNDDTPVLGTTWFSCYSEQQLGNSFPRARSRAGSGGEAIGAPWLACAVDQWRHALPPLHQSQPGSLHTAFPQCSSFVTATCTSQQQQNKH